MFLGHQDLFSLMLSKSDFFACFHCSQLVDEVFLWQELVATNTGLKVLDFKFVQIE